MKVPRVKRDPWVAGMGNSVCSSKTYLYRDLAYIGHWDGWSPYKNWYRKCGAIKVSVATMRKQERCAIDEGYLIGFVPSNLVPMDKGLIHLKVSKFIS